MNRELRNSLDVQCCDNEVFFTCHFPAVIKHSAQEMAVERHKFLCTPAIELNEVRSP